MIRVAGIPLLGRGRPTESVSDRQVRAMGAALRRMRHNAEMSQAAAAVDSGVHVRTVIAYEAGRMLPSPERYLALIETYGRDESEAERFVRNALKQGNRESTYGRR